MDFHKSVCCDACVSVGLGSVCDMSKLEPYYVSIVAATVHLPL